MSDITAAIDIIWSGMQRNQHHPVALAHKLDLRGAYEVQLGLLARHEAQGERQAGWKVGLTSAAMRAQQKVHEPCFSFLLESGYRTSEPLPPAERLRQLAGLADEGLISTEEFTEKRQTIVGEL